MASKRYDTPVDLKIPYEQNEIQLKGIFGFAIGLFLLIVITFGLMWALLAVLKDYSRENAGPPNPMALNDRERLPPEPRLQSAPGFGVDSQHGRVNMELQMPQAEYRELHKQWLELWEHGQKEAGANAPSVLPINEAKERVLAQGLKMKNDPASAEMLNQSRMYVTDASSGRLAAEKRR